ncbi:BON domain-containing protein [Sapientia aquatica]|jgi:osmotically-inducible protein OsmY|uniref:BON domain-containing protein n=1 Tax=Sapientia aquatica TaxID=1549640 RepID=A0A4R5W3D3_9BURK|nr:BON domain-containing protein [Sapientia aquatica]TDK67082.1 BON domain-containing protein [Sapientia aquatica]
MKTDAELQQDILDELRWEQSINATRLGVEVKDGVVTLTGHVDKFTDKWNAEEVVQRVSGIKALAIEIEVSLPGTSQRTDGDIASAAQNILDWNTYLPKDRVHVMVEDGWITLTGTVDWEYQKLALKNSLSPLLGVTGVSDQISISPTVSSVTVKDDIESALRRRARFNEHSISVHVDHADVTLSGSVDSWSERELANHAAWGTPGVHSVINNIKVAL